jgi:hypothetical protein
VLDPPFNDLGAGDRSGDAVEVGEASGAWGGAGLVLGHQAVSVLENFVEAAHGWLSMLGGRLGAGRSKRKGVRERNERAPLKEQCSSSTTILPTREIMILFSEEVSLCLVDAKPPSRST